MARPSIYTPQLALKICERLACGRSLRAICREDIDVPSASTVYYWLAKNKGFSEHYARAREMMAETFFDQILEIADDSRNDFYIDDRGQTRFNPKSVAHARLRINARLWMLARMAPKKYGKRTARKKSKPKGNTHDMSDEQMALKLTALHRAILQQVEAEKALQDRVVDDGSDLV